VTAAPAFGDASQQARVAIVLADQLDLGPKVFAASRRLLARAEELDEQVRRGRVEATHQREQLQRDLMAEPVDPARLLEVLASTTPWRITRPGDPESAPAVAFVAEVVRATRGQAAAAAQAESTGLYRRLQLEAAGVVEATKAAGKLPGKLWNTPDPTHEAMREGVEATWAKLSRAQDRFALIHQLAALLRSMGAFGAQALLPGGAPAWGFAYRQWAKAIEGEQELRHLHPALRLRYAVDHGWEPGLWLADDLVVPEPTTARRGSLGFLVPSPLRSAAERLGVG
jgi:hypothetical protein